LNIPPSATSRWRSLLLPGWTALRTYWQAFLLLQALALGFLFAYDHSAGVRSFCEHLMHWKQRGGMLFASLASMLCGCVIPELIKLKFRPAGFSRPTAGDLLHQLALFGLFGMTVNAFYTLQHRLFGSGRSWDVLLAKILVDQFLYTTLFALPFCIFWFQLRADRYDVKKALGRWSLDYYLRHVLPLFIPNCMYWGPMLIAVYSMPPALQFPLFLFAATAWNLLLIFMAKRQTES
jgi:hypothetical protein